MSGQYCNGFDWYNPTATGAQLWAILQAEGWYLEYIGSPLDPSSFLSSVAGGYAYGRRLKLNGGGSGNQAMMIARPAGSHNSAGGFVSAQFNFLAGNLSLPFLAVYDGIANIRLATVIFGPNGVVSAYRGAGPNDGGILLGNSEVGQFADEVDIDAEAFFKVHSSTGEVEVRINTVSVLHLVNVNTQPGANAYFDMHGFGFDAYNNGLSVGSIVNFEIDNYRYYDTAGINNTFLGTSRVQTSLTAGAGATTDFSFTGGATNWQSAQNLLVDDSKYVYDPNVGDYDLYTIQPLVNSPTVFFVQVTAFVRQDDATQRFYKNRVSSAGTVSDGTSYATPQQYAAKSDILELNPHTGLTFTGAQYNALQIGPLVFA